MSFDEKLKKMQKIKDQAKLGGGQDRIDKQHDQGKLTARERIDLLLDPNSFQEIDSLSRASGEKDDQSIVGDAVVTGWGEINGRKVCIFSQDFTVYGGSLGEVVGKKIVKIMDIALKTGVPIIGLNDSGGARIQEGVTALAGYGDIFLRNVRVSGVIPQISVILGPCAGGAVYSPSITDFIFMTEQTSQMFITGPDVIQAVTGEKTTPEELGGALSHNSKSGVAHFASKNEEETFEEVRRLISFIPLNNLDSSPKRQSSDNANRSNDNLKKIVPDDESVPYDVREVIEEIIDDGDFLEVHEHFAQNIVVGFGSFNNKSVGIVANQPMHLGGVLDINSSRKASRFVRFCDSFNIPIVTLVDVPGYLPGLDQEYGGIITHGAKLVYAFAEATVPKISIILRKGFGGAYDAMGSKHLAADINYAWPSAAIAVMGAGQAINIVSRKELEKAKNKEKKREELINDYRDRLEHPYIAAAKGYIDDIIEPQQTRSKIIKALDLLENKSESLPPKKHGNIPL
ncbi:MAG: methylmalonyl-CoA carboxyltransferase [Chloroflexi bacterium]|nr:methylmalonyl-CoA carboxyltransferase [Chloroflexota bacterium]|tara:strand:- start:836 stop:2377 length:1542 start_codon:yes stop_codon:yes gene_type:complete